MSLSSIPTRQGPPSLVRLCKNVASKCLLRLKRVTRRKNGFSVYFRRSAGNTISVFVPSPLSINRVLTAVTAAGHEFDLPLEDVFSCGELAIPRPLEEHIPLLSIGGHSPGYSFACYAFIKRFNRFYGDDVTVSTCAINLGYIDCLHILEFHPSCLDISETNPPGQNKVWSFFFPDAHCGLERCPTLLNKDRITHFSEIVVKRNITIVCDRRILSMSNLALKQLALRYYKMSRFNPLVELKSEDQVLSSLRSRFAGKLNYFQTEREVQSQLRERFRGKVFYAPGCEKFGSILVPRTLFSKPSPEQVVFELD